MVRLIHSSAAAILQLPCQHRPVHNPLQVFLSIILAVYLKVPLGVEEAESAYNDKSKQQVSINNPLPFKCPHRSIFIGLVSYHVVFRCWFKMKEERERKGEEFKVFHYLSAATGSQCGQI